MKGYEAQKQRPHKLLWMLWLDENFLSNLPSPIHPLGLPPLTPQPSPKIGAEPGAENGPFNFLPLLHLSYISSGSKVAFPGI